MAEPVAFAGANFTYKAPADRDDIRDLVVFRQPKGPCNVACWQLDEDELREVTRTGQVFLLVASGSVIYPTFVGSEENARALALQYGPVWAREGSPA